MALRRGKRITFAMGAAGVAVLGLFVFLFWNRLLEEYYLQRLKSADATVHTEALAALAGLGSARVVPRTLAIRHANPERCFDETLLRRAVQKRGAEGAGDVLSETAREGWPFRVEVANALRSLSAPAEQVAALTWQALRDANPAVRRWGAEMIGNYPAEARRRRERLSEMEMDPDPDVSLWAQIAGWKADAASTP